MPVWLIVCKTALIALSVFAAPVTLWMIITVFIGLGKQKDIESSLIKYYNFAILVCARNEQSVIGNLIDSLINQDYKGKYRIYIVADNCNDNTAKFARSKGAFVFERNDLKHIGKGYAMKFGIDSILKHNPEVEAFLIFDADNLVSSSFLTEINLALNSDAKIACGYRDTKNIHDSWVTEVYSIYWLMLTRFYYAPRYKLGLSPMVGGTGFAFLASCLEDTGWYTKTLTEDVEFSIQQILNGNKIKPVRGAVFYDEQPESFIDSVRQRARWMSGGIECLRIYGKSVLKSALKGNGYLWDVLWYLFFIPISGLTLLTNALSIIVIYNTPILDDYAHFIVIIIIFITIACAWFIAYITLKLEKHNINGMRRAIFMYPIFMLSMMIIALISLFKPKTEWSPIEHINTATIYEREKKGR